MRIHTDVLPDVLVRETRLPRPFINQTIRHLKAAGRIAAGRPYAPPLTARDIARIVLALSATSPGTAVAHERAVGRLTLADGDGPATVEAAIVALIEASASSGQVAVNSAFVEIRHPEGSATYGTLPEGATTIFVIPTSAVHAIAGGLINREQ